MLFFPEHNMYYKHCLNFCICELECLLSPEIGKFDIFVLYLAKSVFLFGHKKQNVHAFFVHTLFKIETGKV